MVHGNDAATRATDRRELRTEAILERAMELLEADGLDGLTLQRVAERLGLVTTAIYRYFPSKDALMAALQRRAVRVISAHFQAELAELAEPLSRTTPPTAGLATLLVVAELYLALPRTHPEEWRFVARLLGDPKQLLSDDEAARTAPLLEGFLRNMATVFALAQETEALSAGDPNERVFAYWAALHGAHCMDKVHRVAPHTPGVDAIGRLTIHALLASWGATPARLTAARELTRKLQPMKKLGTTTKKGRV